ncbi:MAG: hypothetical protein ACOYL4_10295 [Miltoncostaeaceae bacterium]
MATRTAVVLSLAGACALSLGGIQASALANPATGFTSPFSGTPRYERFAPKQATTPAQVNAPLGQRAADQIAVDIGLNPKKVFTSKQYALFVSGKGVGGQAAPAKLVDESVRILTNTTNRPLYSMVDGQLTPTVLASYGVMVNTSGMLESPANTDAPTRQVNTVIEPGGYLGKWCKANGAKAALANLYASAYTREAVYGNAAQQQSGVAQLVSNQKNGVTTTVGMSMVPSIWIVNFALIYTLNPKLAAKMPARWTPIPADVASAIAASPTGQVPWSQYSASLPR